VPKGIYKRTEYHNNITRQNQKKLSASRIGKHHSEETKKKIGIAHKGKIVSNESKEKNRLAHLGKYTPSKKRNLGVSLAKMGHKVSQETRSKISKSVRLVAKKGKDSSLWRGGKMKNYPELFRIRMSIEYRLWREAVFARDNWTCQKTNVKGCKLHAHHIQNFNQYPELRFAIDNGITLSEKAHREFHKKYSTQNNTKKQIIEFIDIVKTLQ